MVDVWTMRAGVGVEDRLKGEIQKGLSVNELLIRWMIDGMVVWTGSRVLFLTVKEALN